MMLAGDSCQNPGNVSCALKWSARAYSRPSTALQYTKSRQLCGGGI